MDTYHNFFDLAAAEHEGVDFRIRVQSCPGASTVVVAPHGGGIEPGTSEIVQTIAGCDLSFALFEGTKSTGNAILHITSTNFDEPRCLDLVRDADQVLAVHGEDSDAQVIFLGGKDTGLSVNLRDALTAAGFAVQRHPNADLQGTADDNICNRNKRGAGVQLELSRGLRAKFFRTLSAAGRKQPTVELVRFANAVRTGLGLGELAQKPGPADGASTKDEQDKPLFFRDGARAEYLAQYILSQFGAAISVPRQEDHGFDVYCSIDVATEGNLSDFQHAYFVQLKLGEPKEVSFGGMTPGEKWRRGQVHWLLNLDIPLLLGFVNIEAHTIKLFQTSARWLLYYTAINSRMPLQVLLTPSESVSEPVPTPSKAKAAQIPGKHDGNNWSVSLGPALLEIKLSDLSVPDKVAQVKRVLSDYVQLERTNIAHRELGTQYAQWVCKIDWDQKQFQRAWVIEASAFPRAVAAGFDRECGPYLATLIFRLAAAGNTTALKNACDLFRQLEPGFSLPENLRSLLDDILHKN